MEQICERCNEKYEISKRTILHRKRNNVPGYCSTCMKIFKNEKIKFKNIEYYKNNQDAKKQLSDIKRKQWNEKSDDSKAQELLRLKNLRDNYWNNLSVIDKRVIFDKRNDSNKRIWDNDLKRNQQSQNMIILWKSITDEDRITRIHNNSLAQQKFWNTVSAEYKLNKSIELNEGYKKWWDKLSDADKLKRVSAIIEYYNNLSVEERSELSNKHKEYWDADAKLTKSISMIDYFTNLSDEDKAGHMKGLNNYWNNISYNERLSINNLISEKLKSFWDNITDDQFEKWNKSRINSIAVSANKPKGNEIKFMNDINTICNIMPKSYEYQYYNNIRNPIFEDIIDSQKYNGKRIDWRHRWDFKIKTKNNSEILVYIDGSIHAIGPDLFIVGGLDVGLYIQFNDSKRPYQTDGLEAWVILDYGDNLNDNTLVERLDDSDTMIYKEFLEYLRQ